MSSGENQSHGQEPGQVQNPLPDSVEFGRSRSAQPSEGWAQDSRASVLESIDTEFRGLHRNVLKTALVSVAVAAGVKVVLPRIRKH